MNITIIILILVAIVLFLSGMLQPSPAKDITQDEFIARQNAGDSMVILDVRTKEEFAQGYIKGAVNIAHTQLASHLQDIPKDKDIIIYCRSGRRVGMAAKILKNNGYEKLFHLDGDMNEWLKNRKPVSVN